MGARLSFSSRRRLALGLAPRGLAVGREGGPALRMCLAMGACLLDGHVCDILQSETGLPDACRVRTGYRTSMNLSTRTVVGFFVIIFGWIGGFFLILGLMFLCGYYLRLPDPPSWIAMTFGYAYLASGPLACILFLRSMRAQSARESKDLTHKNIADLASQRTRKPPHSV